MTGRPQLSTVCQFLAVWCPLLLLLTGGTHPADGVRVLAFGGVAARSHWHFMKGVLLALADAGHPVTVYTPFPDREAAAVSGGGLYTEVDISAEYGNEHSGVGLNATVVVPLFASPLFVLPFMANGSHFICELADRLLADRRAGEFDVFVTEPLGDDGSWRVARRLGVPLVYTVPAPLLPWIEALAFGRAANPSHVPHALSARSAVAVTFCRRLFNAFLYLYTTFVHRRASANLNGGWFLQGEPPIEPAVVFVNTHHVTEPSRPAPANRVDIGGVHLQVAKPLPADILEFIEGAEHGVIYLSFGTVVTLSSLPNDVQKAFIDAIAEVPQRVLMKYETQMPDKPKNVMTSKWLPQRDVLLHPKVKLFIGHGGISGLYEAVDAGVPVLGFPLFYDQPRNVDSLVNEGMAISLNLFSITKDVLLKSINDLMNNETYAQNAKTVSKIFKDRPISPAQSVVYWMDYIVRHKGAPHFKPFTHNLSWYQYFLIDVITVVLFITILIYYFMCKVLKLIKLLYLCSY